MCCLEVASGSIVVMDIEASKPVGKLQSAIKTKQSN